MTHKEFVLPNANGDRNTLELFSCKARGYATDAYDPFLHETYKLHVQNISYPVI